MHRMIYRFLVLLPMFLLSISLVASEDGWINLFNGNNFDGWEKLNGKAEYRIEGDAIVGVSQMNTPNTFLATEKKYTDFIFEVDVMVDPRLNSGIQFRSISTADYNNGRVHGYQAEIDPSTRSWSGGIYDEARRGWLYPLALNPMGQKAFKNGEWNSYHIEAIGNEIRIWINGVNTANLVDDMTGEGFIALQVHSINNEMMAGSEVRWRNIRVMTDDLEENRWQMHPEVREVNLVPNTLSEYEARKGWRLLWDGKSSDGWRAAKGNDFPASGWTMNDGILTVLESGGAESTNGGDIVTRATYSNFELVVDFKITEGANSGIKYFVDPELNKGQGSAIGLEYQLLDDKEHPDAALGVSGNRTLGSLYDLIPAGNLSTSRPKPFNGIGTWNQARIISKGNHVEHWLNGQKILEFDRNNQAFQSLVNYSKYKDWPNFGKWTEGHILLQDHGNTVYFRSIKIREF